MSLEEDIRQQKFQNEHQKAAINILYTGSWLYNLHAGFLKKFDITPEQFNVLRILRGSHPTPLMLADISSHMIDRKSNCTRLVEKLRKKGFVKQEICKESRRQVDISITRKGLLLLKEIDANQTAWQERLGSISRADAKELNRILDRLRG